MDLIDIIQKLIQDGVEQLKLTDMTIGTVMTNAPLSITIDALMLPIPQAALLLTDAVSPKSVSGTTSDGASFTVVITQPLQVGEKVILLRCAGGQRYIVLSRVQAQQ